MRKVLKKKEAEFEIKPRFIKNKCGIITHITLPSEAFFLPDESFLELKDILITGRIYDNQFTRNNYKTE